MSRELCRSRGYLLGVLLVVLAFNGVDRLAFGLLLQDIKIDLHLSDTELGVLSGIAFALFYSIMGIPIARWADRGNRVSIIAITCLVWSAAVALCGSAGNLLQLLLIRVAVAVGEAGGVPPANSLIADHFARSERARAVAIYMLGGSLSTLIGNFLAGWLNELYGWRKTFVLLGLPGVAIAALVWFTLKDPRAAGSQRSAPGGSVGTSAPPCGRRVSLEVPGPSFMAVCVSLWTNRTFRQLLLAFVVLGFCSIGIWQWVPTFFVRSYGLKSAELGAWYALIWGLGGALGTLSGGALASRYAVHNERLQLKVIAALHSLFGVVVAALLLSPSAGMAFAMMGICAVGMCTISGPLLAIIQTLAPERMRALSIAIVYLFTNLIGMGVGPLAVGVLSDALHPVLGENSLRYALLLLCLTYLWGGWHLWRASKTVADDLNLS